MITLRALGLILGTDLVSACNATEIEGRTVSTTRAGVPFDLTGFNTGSTAGAAFYGLDTAAGVPDEVGGVALMEGQDGAVIATFLAD